MGTRHDDAHEFDREARGKDRPAPAVWRAADVFASPAAEHGPATIVLQEWWGLEEHIRSVCDRFAAEGFFALAPDLFRGDSDLLHVCICGTDYESSDGTKVDVAPLGAREGSADGRPMNDVYFELVSRRFPPRVREFRPDLVFWYFGFDTHQGDYGDIGLTGPCYWRIARLMRELAEEICGGRLEVVLGGGSQRRIATALIPPIIEELAGLAAGRVQGAAR